MSNVLGMLSYSGPLPIEDVLWRAGDAPGEALEQIINMAGQGLVMVNGIDVEKLHTLLREVREAAPENADLTLGRIHTALADTSPTIELTRSGLRSAPAVA
jgi:hypothetical protein